MDYRRFGEVCVSGPTGSFALTKEIGMSNSMERMFLESKLRDMEQQFKMAQNTMANHARNALVALDEDDIDEVRKILNALAGNEDAE
jgi:hypothetical protein